MKSWLLEHVLNHPISPRRIEYLTLDEDLKILETSSAVQQFAEFPQEIIKGKDVRLAFPEFIGVEEVLTAMFSGEENSFELKGIKRFSEPHPPFYIVFKDVKVVCQTKTGTKITIFFSCSTIQTDIKELKNFVYIGRTLTESQAENKY
jgi:adenylate cyclase